MVRGKGRICDVHGCEQTVYSRGWCCAHYHRWRKTGDPQGSRRKSLEFRVWGKVLKDAETGCWLHTNAPVGHMGYRAVKVGRQSIGAHRVSWTLANGPIPDGLRVLHRCDTPACVNPDHLFLGTDADNNRDRDAKGRQRVPRGESNKWAKLTEEQVLAIRSAYVPRQVTQRKLAAKYGVTPGTIAFILQRQTWTHLEEAS